MSVKNGYKHGIVTSDVINPVSDNYMANFVRGAVMYATDEEARKLRAEKIDIDKAAARAYLLEISRR